jgi:hypothetical protein
VTAIIRGGYAAGGMWLSVVITAAETVRRRAFRFPALLVVLL